MKYTFDKENLLRILRGALISGGAVALLFILEAVAGMDFGEYTPFVVGLCAILINAVKEFIRGK